MVEAGGETVLNWKQALDAAIERFQKVEKPGFLEAADLTVQTAVDEYSAMRGRPPPGASGAKRARSPGRPGSIISRIGVSARTRRSCAFICGRRSGPGRARGSLLL
jgi:hypothetical protein